MIVLYPLLLIGALFIALRRQGTTGGRGWPWFGAWAAAIALIVVSFLTGFSIGLLLLPGAAALLYWTAIRSPHAAEALGGLVGVGLNLWLIAVLRGWVGWHIAGTLFCLLGLCGYTALLARRTMADDRRTSA